MAAADELAPLAGVVLAGGHSVRMGVDKASMDRRGISWLDRSVALVARHCRSVTVAIRPDQQDDPLRARHARSLDPPGVEGPMAGIQAGFLDHPGHALLVLACDFPDLDPELLERLVAARRPDRDVAAVAAEDGRPHPLCAIWEPVCRAALDAAIAAGERSPRRFLEDRRLTLLDPGGAGLRDVNRPADLA